MKSQLVEMVYRTIEKPLSDKAVRGKIIHFIQQWFDRNSEVILDSGLTDRPVITQMDENFFFETLGCSRELVKEAIQKSGLVSTDWKTLNNEIYIFIVMIIRYFTINKMAKEVKLVYTFLAFKIYSNLHFKFFRFGAKREIMDYTINGLSMKNDIKRLHTLYAAMEKLADQSHETYTPNLKSNDDDLLFKYAINLRTRLNNFVKNVAQAYMENWKNGNYMNVDDPADDSEDNFKPERTSNSAQVENLARSAFFFFVSSVPNDRALSLAAKGNEVSLPALKATVESARRDADKDIEGMFRAILDMLITERKDTEMRSICSREFLPFVMGIYSRSNTTDKNVLDIKAVLNRILSDHCSKYAETGREATKISYRKALFAYLTLILQIHKCSE